MPSHVAVQRYCHQPLCDGPFYRPGQLSRQTALWYTKEVPKLLKLLPPPSSLLHQGPPSLTHSGLSAQCSSIASNLPAPPKETWVSSSDETQFSLAELNRCLLCSGEQFEARLNVDAEQQQQEKCRVATDDAAVHQADLPKDIHLSDVTAENETLARNQIVALWLSRKAVMTSRANQLLEMKFRLLFETSPNLLALYGRVHRGQGSSSNSAHGGTGGILNSDQGINQMGNNKSTDDDNGHDDTNDNGDEGDKGEKNNKNLDVKRYHEGFPEREFLCVMLVGDPANAFAVRCAHHHPSIVEIFRHLKNTHKERFRQVEQAVWNALKKHSPTKTNCGDPIDPEKAVALWKTWHGILFPQRQLEFGSWYYTLGTIQYPSCVQTPIEGLSTYPSQSLQVPDSRTENETNLESIEESVQLAAQEAREAPEIELAIEAHHDDVHEWRRQKQRALEEVERKYEDDLQEAHSARKVGEKRARETRDDREKQVQQQFETARLEIDDVFVRKIARSRRARQPPHENMVHEAAETQSPNPSSGAHFEVPSPYLAVPPATPRSGLSRDPTPSDGPIIEEGSSTPRSSISRPSLSQDGFSSPKTPTPNALIDPQILRPSSSAASAPRSRTSSPDFGSALDNMRSSMPLISTEYCQSKNCFRKALLDQSYCEQHGNTEGIC